MVKWYLIRSIRTCINYIRSFREKRIPIVNISSQNSNTSNIIYTYSNRSY